MRSWIEREFALDGVLAAGGGGIDGRVFSAFAAGEFVLAHNDEIWRCLAVTVEKLRSLGVPTGEMVWGFEQALLCTIRREDGAWLGVFTSPQLRDESALTLRGRLDAFKQHDFTSLV